MHKAEKGCLPNFNSQRDPGYDEFFNAHISKAQLRHEGPQVDIILTLQNANLRLRSLSVQYLAEISAHACSPPPFPGCPGRRRGRGRGRHRSRVPSQVPRPRPGPGKKLILGMMSLVVVVGAIWRLKLAVVGSHSALPVGGRYSKEHAQQRLALFVKYFPSDSFSVYPFVSIGSGCCLSSQ